MKHILILEDTSYVIEGLIREIRDLESELYEKFEISVYSTSREVKQIVNQQPADSYDVIILDRNASDGSFHELDIAKFGPRKIISISSIDRFNENMKIQGVKHTVLKSHDQLERFFSQVREAIREIM